MNLAIFIRSLYTGTGGAEKQAFLLAKCMEENHTAHIIVFKGERLDEKYKQLLSKPGISYYCLKGNLPKKLFQFFTILKKQKIDAIVSYLAVNNFWGGIIGRLAGVKFLIGGIRNSWYSRKKLLLQRFIHNHLSDYTIFNNYKGYHELLRSGFRKDNAVVIPNGIEMTSTPMAKEKRDTVVVITVARFVAQKDHLNAIKAIRYLLDNYSLQSQELKYQLVGYGPLENVMREWIIQYGLETVVELVIRPANLNEYYLNADIYLCASTFEGVSNSVLEALSFGLPVVATDAGDNTSMVPDGESGFIVQVGDYKAIADCLYQLIHDQKKRTEFGNRGFALCREKYSMEAFRQAYLNFFETLEKKAHGPQ